MARQTIAVASTKDELRLQVGDWRSNGQSVALVPTMGALHEGHLALVRHAKRLADRTVTSIFVNPRQFAPQEDFATYPRTFDDDCCKLAEIGCDLVWAPTMDAMYPDGFATTVTVDGPARGLESDVRPGFFAGVATVCCKLFRQVAPHIAVFGEKDYQQLLVVTRMAQDLDLDLRIIGHPTIRESDGLAMSSRNAYLSTAEREVAPRLHARMLELREMVLSGIEPGIAGRLKAEQLVSDGFRSVDYLTLRCARTLSEYDPAEGRPGRIMAAAWLGTTRLIDNIPLEP